MLHTYMQSLEGLLEGMNPPPSDPELFVSFRDCHLLILKMIQVYIPYMYASLASFPGSTLKCMEYIALFRVFEDGAWE